MNFDETIQLHVLQLKASTSIRGPILDQILDQADSVQVRQMCAKVSVELYDHLEQVCGLLGMTKREFIESAVSDALDRAQQAIDRSGVLDQGG